jgi:hypothetical protein
MLTLKNGKETARMKLSGFFPEMQGGHGDIEITHLTFDSRAVKQGSLYFGLV